MKPVSTISALFIDAFLALLGQPFAEARAQALRTWVSGVGDDANPCLRTAPCRTFAGAISRTAAGGEIDALDPGGYGAVTITGAITIDGGAGQVASILAGGTNAIVVNAGATDIVTVRNLAMDGVSQSASPGLNGVRFLAGGGLNIENVNIFNFSQIGIDFEPSQATNSFLKIQNSTISTAGQGAIYVKPTGGGLASATLVNVDASSSLFGLRVDDNGRADVAGGAFTGNINNGVIANSTRTPAIITVKRSLVSRNGNFGVHARNAGASIAISDVGVFDNGIGIFPETGGVVVSFGNNQNFGNGAPGAPSITVPQQ